MPPDPVLVVEGLHVTYTGSGRGVRALRGVDVSVDRGGAVGVVGESGSGKTTLALTTPMLLPAEAEVRGSVRVNGQQVVGAGAGVLRQLRWRRVACVVQAPGRGFNPVRTVASQMAEPLRLHLKLGGDEARERSRQLAEAVALDPDLIDRYPHQLSGGERQRAMLAMALGCDPDLLVLDEPTSGLDSATRLEIIHTLRRLRQERSLALLVVSHDIASVAKLVDDVIVLYAGAVLERGPAPLVLGDPRHPYSRDLLAAYPTMTTQKDLRGIRGAAPDPADPPQGCPYHPRCTQAIDDCAAWAVALGPVAGREVACLRGGVLTRLAARGLRKSYRLDRRRVVEAVRSVSLDVREGEVLGVVGETGSGKSTLARLLMGLDQPEEGTLQWEGRDTSTFGAREWADFRRRAAIVFQDPYEATSPRFSVEDVVAEPLVAQRTGTAADRREQARQALAEVGLAVTDDILRRRAHELSGGQLQRVAVARALVLGPRLLVADEPTSMLDASEQAKLLALIKDLQVQRGMAMVMISHDLALVRKVADRILVLHEGEAVEEGPAHLVVTAPRAGSTRRLVAAAPTLVTGSEARPSPT